eukprot:gene10887-2962_t
MDKSRVARVVGQTYADTAHAAIRTRRAAIDQLIEKQKLPEHGWDDASIELLLQELALMDSNNFPGNVGLGEREGRIASDIVRRMHMRLAHGVGRSGDIAAIQPKAAGSSLLARIAESMMLDLLKLAGMTRLRSCIILPLATGMSIVMCLLTLRQIRPSAKYVIWFRIDQKTCLKAIVTAGFEPIVIHGILEGDAIKTNISEFERILNHFNLDQITCVVTTTSCFAPREMDDVITVSRICKDKNIPHIVNNAYGVQSTKCTHLINEAIRVGSVDAVVQSTDKNLMVPVGGAVVGSHSKTFIAALSKTYPGRASGTAARDVFITLLHYGSRGYHLLMVQRKERMQYLRAGLEKIALAYNERLLDVRGNPISCGMSLVSIEEKLATAGKDVTFLGSLLFTRRVSGTRVISPRTQKEVAGIVFKGYGSHINEYPVPYLTCAAAIGLSQDEVDTFLHRLNAVLLKIVTVEACTSSQRIHLTSTGEQRSDASRSVGVLVLQQLLGSKLSLGSFKFKSPIG